MFGMVVAHAQPWLGRPAPHRRCAQLSSARTTRTLPQTSWSSPQPPLLSGTIPLPFQRAQWPPRRWYTLVAPRGARPANQSVCTPTPRPPRKAPCSARPTATCAAMFEAKSAFNPFAPLSLNGASQALVSTTFENTRFRPLPRAPHTRSSSCSSTAPPLSQPRRPSLDMQAFQPRTCPGASCRNRMGFPLQRARAEKAGRSSLFFARNSAPPFL